MRRLRTVALALIALASLAVAPSAVARADWAVLKAPAAQRNVASVRALESQVLADVNAERAKRGLRPLRFNAELARAAHAHSRDMARRGYFTHASADGSAFWRRVARYYRSAGFRYWSVGENLLWSSPDVSSGSAITMWLNSPGHRANLLSPRWREVGLAAVHVGSAPGFFGGREVTIVTANFGVRTR
jgi:uncharacterized protein YkwD